MHTIRKRILLLLFFLLVFTASGITQDSTYYDLEYEVNRVDPALSMSRGELLEANTIEDLNRFYKSSWVREFINVEIMAYYEGHVKKVVNKNDILSQEQKDLMRMADVDTDISVRIHYIPENTLKQNDAKEFDFKFRVNPDSEASYKGGQEKLMKYLSESRINEIEYSNIKKYHLAAVKFTIDTEGRIVDPHIVESSRDKQIDDLLLQTVCNMSTWQPAEYANGTRIPQEFVLTVGDHRSCVINLLNIRKFPAEE